MLLLSSSPTVPDFEWKIQPCFTLKKERPTSTAIYREAGRVEFAIRDVCWQRHQRSGRSRRLLPIFKYHVKKIVPSVYNESSKRYNVRTESATENERSTF